MHILYLCPHGAAKSVIATSLTREMTARMDVCVTAANAGTEPDEENSPIALEALRTRGLTHATPPSLVLQHDIEQADIVVTLGCPIESLPAGPAVLGERIHTLLVSP